MNTKKIPRWTGQAEFWFNKEKNIVILRSSKYDCDVFSMNKGTPFYWKKCLFKKPWSFDLYNGSQYLTQKGFVLISRV